MSRTGGVAAPESKSTPAASSALVLATAAPEDEAVRRRSVAQRFNARVDEPRLLQVGVISGPLLAADDTLWELLFTGDQLNLRVETERGAALLKRVQALSNPSDVSGLTAFQEILYGRKTPLRTEREGMIDCFWHAYRKAVQAAQFLDPFYLIQAVPDRMLVEGAASLREHLENVKAKFTTTQAELERRRPLATAELATWFKDAAAEFNTYVLAVQQCVQIAYAQWKARDSSREDLFNPLVRLPEVIQGIPMRADLKLTPAQRERLAAQGVDVSAVQGELYNGCELPEGEVYLASSFAPKANRWLCALSAFGKSLQPLHDLYGEALSAAINDVRIIAEIYLKAILVSDALPWEEGEQQRRRRVLYLPILGVGDIQMRVKLALFSIALYQEHRSCHRLDAVYFVTEAEALRLEFNSGLLSSAFSALSGDIDIRQLYKHTYQRTENREHSIVITTCPLVTHLENLVKEKTAGSLPSLTGDEGEGEEKKEEEIEEELFTDGQRILLRNPRFFNFQSGMAYFLNIVAAHYGSGIRAAIVDLMMRFEGEWSALAEEAGSVSARIVEHVGSYLSPGISMGFFTIPLHWERHHGRDVQALMEILSVIRDSAEEENEKIKRMIDALENAFRRIINRHEGWGARWRLSSLSRAVPANINMIGELMARLVFLRDKLLKALTEAEASLGTEFVYPVVINRGPTYRPAPLRPSVIVRPTATPAASPPTAWQPRPWVRSGRSPGTTPLQAAAAAGGTGGDLDVAAFAPRTGAGVRLPFAEDSGGRRRTQSR